MACQKVCKQGRDNIIVKVNLQSPIPTSFYITVYCILFGMLSLHRFTFLMFFQSCFCTFFMLISVTVTPKPKNISFKCNSTTPELEIALTI